MSRQQSLLQGILDDPDDDAIRLIYADWLEEHDQPDRAEFIRVQLALHQLRDAAVEAQQTLRQREKALWAKHGATWKEELPAWARSGVTYERGFAWQVSATMAQLVQGGRKLWRTAPMQAVNLVVGRNKAGERIEEFALQPFLKRVRSLSLAWNQLSPIDVEMILSSPHLLGLRSLWLAGNEEGDTLARLVASEPAWVAELQILDLRETMLGDAGATALAAARWQQLAALDLGGNSIGSRGLFALAGSRSLVRLAILRIDYQHAACHSDARPALEQRFGKALQFA
jgi:uncharacterized protein (TIGR02996 family)